MQVALANEPLADDKMPTTSTWLSGDRSESELQEREQQQQQ